MQRRTILGFGLAAPTPGFQRAAAPRRSKPNILFLMTDQQRGDCLGTDGNRAIRTPHLDRLAREGAYFSQAYSTTPTCTPARSALLTGLAPWNHGLLGYQNIPASFAYEKPRALADQGYRTCSIGKNHFQPWRNSHGYQQMFLDEHVQQRPGEERTDYETFFYSQRPHDSPYATGLGWNDYAAKPFAYPEALHPTTWTGDTAVRYLNQADPRQPFYLKVSFIRPHSPYDPPQRYWDMYRDTALPKAQVGAWAARYEQPSSGRPDIWHGKLSGEQIRESRRGYYACITHVDDQIGRILETLEKRKMLEETLILFTSDHGDMTGDHNLWRKSYAYQASVRIPMLVRWPQGLVAAKRGVRIEAPVEIRDIFPTFLDAAGTSPARPLDGESLLKLCRDPQSTWRETIDLEHDICYSPRNNWNALTDGKMKYIFHAYDGEEQLFDLRQDPHETRDLAGDAASAPALQAWRQKMVQHLAPRGDFYVKGGQLALRPQGRNRSPNFPGTGK
jgi:arylsulfatase A-like enzyme